ncbi:MAG: hypothetical protein ACKO5K_09070, partial [Armatimonadota bacterium]
MARFRHDLSVMADTRPVQGVLLALAPLAVACAALLPARSTAQIKPPTAKSPDFAKEVQPLLRAKC